MKRKSIFDSSSTSNCKTSIKLDNKGNIVMTDGELNQLGDCNLAYAIVDAMCKELGSNKPTDLYTNQYLADANYKLTILEITFPDKHKNYVVNFITNYLNEHHRGITMNGLESLNQKQLKSSK